VAQMKKLDWGGPFSLALRELSALARLGEAPELAKAGASNLSEPRLKGRESP
jgi:hypothetical protein